MNNCPAKIRAAITTGRHRFPAIVIILASVVSAAAAQPPVLTSTVIRGSSVYTPSELFAVYQRHLGQPVDRQLAAAIVSDLAALYVADGYLRPGIAVDDSLIAAGILRIDVTETQIEQIELTGNPGPYRERLELLASAAHDEQLLRRQELLVMLRRMRRLPGLELVTSTTRNASDPSAYRLNVEADFDPFGGSVRMTNRGTDEVGPHFVLGQLTFRGLAHGNAHAGLLFGAAADTDEFRGFGGTTTYYGQNDASVTLVAFRSESRPQEEPVDADIYYLRDRVSLAFDKPIVDRAVWSLSAGASLRLEDLRIDRDAVMIRDERLRMLELGVDFRHGIGGRVQYAHSIDLSKGLGGLGSRLTALDLAVDPRRADFWLIRARFIRLARLNEIWTWRMDAFLQHSPYPLPYSQRFKIGGDRLGRGFEVAEIAGDQGLGGKLEARRRIAERGAARWSAYGFYDIGAVWKQDLAGRESAATAGIGVGVEAAQLRGSVELAQPLTQTDVEGRHELSLFTEMIWSF